jgi:FtsZ-binding cell division protein ZapB
MSAPHQESDALAALEERIHKAVELVVQLRGEKEAALRDVQEAHAKAARLADEVEALRAERKQVRGRIEKLLGHIDQLSTS